MTNLTEIVRTYLVALDAFEAAPVPPAGPWPPEAKAVFHAAAARLHEAECVLRAAVSEVPEPTHVTTPACYAAGCCGPIDGVLAGFAALAGSKS